MNLPYEDSNPNGRYGCLWVLRLTDWANEEVMWNSQFYVIHKQLYLGIKLVKTIYWVNFYCECVGHSSIVG